VGGTGDVTCAAEMVRLCESYSQARLGLFCVTGRTFCFLGFSPSPGFMRTLRFELQRHGFDDDVMTDG
jgi:hypothetical protein